MLTVHMLPRGAAARRDHVSAADLDFSDSFIADMSDLAFGRGALSAHSTASAPIRLKNTESRNYL